MATRDVAEELRAAMEGEPVCAVCDAGADFLLYREAYAPTFACWEHVSPVVTVSDVAPDETDRPVAIPVSDAFR